MNKEQGARALSDAQDRAADLARFAANLARESDSLNVQRSAINIGTMALNVSDSYRRFTIYADDSDTDERVRYGLRDLSGIYRHLSILLSDHADSLVNGS